MDRRFVPSKREFTKSPDGQRCRWCGREIPPRHGPGRRREFCRDSCRQLDYQARRRAAGSGLDDDEIIVSRHEVDDLHDRLYVLEAAVEDVERDLADEPSLRDYEDAVAWLLEAIRPVIEKRLLSDAPVT
jgi:hypothetical protein